MNGLKSATLWIVVFLVFIGVYVAINDREAPQNIPVSKLMEMAEGKKIKGTIVDKGGEFRGKFIDEQGNERTFYSKYTEKSGETVFKSLIDSGVTVEDQPGSEVLQQIFFSLILPLLVIVILWALIMRQIQSGGNKAMSFGKSRAKLINQGQTKVTFNDVAGVDEAKVELLEVVEFLRDPQKFSRLGGKIPKGVLLVGPPGTGKTLLAKAVAGEANVPFFSISGSDFVEMFVGVGASRVRDLFEQAKKHKPCLVFMDEIDAVGRHRFAGGFGGGHDEREQTLNQLLVEMDGFNTNEGVILIAATNRPDVLDPALLRPGRFDRQVTVDYPDVAGREKILAVHAAKVKLSKTCDLTRVAKGTPGFSGADLANLINEAALIAARRDKDEVGDAELDEAKDRVMMGPERRSLVLTEKEKQLIAYHEAGHALAAKIVEAQEEVHKITIIPRGHALGLTHYLPGEERRTQFKSVLKDRLVHTLGGRAAEEIIFGDFTTGAASDLQHATQLAYRMVCEFGMSDVLGSRTYGDSGASGGSGRELTVLERNFSDQTAAVIDAEVKKIVDEAHQRAVEILSEHREALVRIADALIERETIDGNELDMLIRGETLPELPPPPPPPTGTPEPEPEEEKAKRGSKIFGTSIIDRPRELPN